MEMTPDDKVLRSRNRGDVIDLYDRWRGNYSLFWGIKQLHIESQSLFLNTKVPGSIPVPGRTLVYILDDTPRL